MNELIGTSGVPSPSLPLGAQSLIGALSITTLLMERLPGYDKIRRIMRGLGIDMNTAAGAAMVSPLLITCYNLSYSTITALIDRYYSTSVRINSEDMRFGDLFTWLSEEQTADVNRSHLLDAMKVSGDPANAGDGTGHMNEGRYVFDYRGRKISIMMEEAKEGLTMHGSQQRIVLLRSYGRDPAVLDELLEEVVRRSNTRKSNARDQGKTIVFHANMSPHGMPPRWERALSRPNRSMETVVLEKEQKELIIRDIKEYLLPATAEWYANRGLPYRRGYLFYGPPGTGKTSLSMALAGLFNLEVYSLSLSAGSLTDDTLAMLFAGLPSRCIVLLEDVDASSVKRMPAPTHLSSSPSSPSSLARTISSSPYSVTNANASFSGLLNAIDGAASREGRILIMTTNYRERLDPALIRPGRVDLQISFRYPSRDAIKSLFLNIYSVDSGDREALRIPEGFPPVDKIVDLAREFSRVLPEGVFTPAEIQGLLLMHKKDPVAAVGAAGEWAREKRTEKGVEEGGEEGGEVEVNGVIPNQNKGVIEGGESEEAGLPNGVEENP